MNGDILTDLDYSSFHDAHVRKKAVFTISSFLREQRIDYGVLQVDHKKELCGFQEKPVSHHEVSMGIYMVSRSVVDVIPGQRAYGFDELMIELIRRKMPVDVRTHSSYWLDIGRPDDYGTAIEVFDANEGRFLRKRGHEGSQIQGGGALGTVHSNRTTMELPDRQLGQSIPRQGSGNPEDSNGK